MRGPAALKTLNTICSASLHFAPAAQGGTCIMVGDDQKWIKEAGEIAVAKFGCKIFSKTLFHIPTGGSHDQETFNHEKFETKCAGKDLLSCSCILCCAQRQSCRRRHCREASICNSGLGGRNRHERAGMPIP